MNIIIAPSILASDFAALGEECRRMQNAGADILHVDVMDGHFVPNLTIGPAVVRALRKRVALPLDVHLMVTDPALYAPAFIEAGADIVTFHLEAQPQPAPLLKKIRNLGAKAGLVLNPGTPAESALPYLPLCDIVLVMTVNPGFGGQAFMPEQLPKLACLRAAAPYLPIEVDGGIGVRTARSAAEAGANVFVAGSSLFSSPDYRTAISSLRAAARRETADAAKKQPAGRGA